MASYLDILKSLQSSTSQQSVIPQVNLQHKEPSINNPYSLQHTYMHTSIPSNSIYSETQSFIQYIPFKRKVLHFQQRHYKQKVPHLRKINDHIQKISLQTVPRQRTQMDYYAVEHLRYYQKEIIPEKSIQYVPVVRTVKRTQFVPVERKIVHYPKDIDIETLEKEVILTDRQNTLQYQRTPSFSNKFYEGDHQKVVEYQQTPLIPVSSLVQSVRTQSPVKQSPIKSYTAQLSSSKLQSKQDYIQQFQDRVQTSILNSLSKAYQIQQSTKIKQSDDLSSIIMRGGKRQINQKKNKNDNSPLLRRQNKTPHKKYQVSSRPITKYEQMKHYRPSTLREINYRSTQTIDSRHLRNL